ncbi:tetratricopeptide (TPR) repeat protein [Rhabdobacter roseus]|uniref:Tetratricopeptide (TPR) repeat protein n=1 Tax=Rhabdobacter roseus TaxID=1655419 RepID=A0A840TKL2_9BACT|nr:hypothetical protein [Rhabdobacter roseus]MBB5284726.1 tetratricopeptide (TPR) repeat protein [Rhabdobacter roseus]
MSWLGGLLGLLVLPLAGAGQDLFDYSHSERFARHLLRSGQYQMATSELERLLFMAPADSTLPVLLLRAYRLAGQPEQGMRRAGQLYPGLLAMPEKAAWEYGRFLLEQEQFQQAEDFWQKSLPERSLDKRLLLSTSRALRDQYGEALRLLEPLEANEHPLVMPYRELLEEAVQQRTKSPWLAGTLSTLVPASGRFYTRDWKDGLVSLLFMGTTAWQSYRGFRANGTRSARGWIYGGISFGFYVGNIYGSVRSAKQYNDRQVGYYRTAVKNVFNGYY